MLNDDISLNFSLYKYDMTYTVQFLLLIYLVTWRRSSKRAETCRQPNEL